MIPVSLLQRSWKLEKQNNIDIQVEIGKGKEKQRDSYISADMLHEL